ncbi:spore germination protein GerPB [Aquibacillus rhizosphaerae]|uniref:Spore germination protein GerPB n=1 Tax=Aquibacillus rhizosphaerae TaxID=3051431 RepID=A0ABT7LCH3_9BACI|nr:spore germination protein GerPB [Aquibacillus sp. LR5S19]MDL4842870.1 spore germination protein GerPB [Aquibacillus sp. LR5S19]
MHLTIHQSINIHMLKVGSVSNSSVLQIGSAGSIQASAKLYNTGEYTELAEPISPEGAETPLVPLIGPTS